MKRVQIYYFVSILAAFLIMGMGRYFASVGIGWYDTLRLADTAPPKWLYSLVWPFLYTCLIRVAVWLFHDAPSGRYWPAAITFFSINIIGNASWSYLFFYKKMIFAGLVDCVIVFISAFILMLLIAKESKSIALLLLPYTVWLLFASYQNYMIWMLN